MITVIHGSDAFLIERAFQRVLAAWRDRDTSDFNYEVLDPGATIESLQHAIMTPPLLDAVRLVVWKDPLLLTDARRASAETLDRLAPLLEQMPDSVHLVVAVHRTIPAGHPLLQVTKGLNAAGRAGVERYDPPRGVELARWVQEEAAESGVTLTRDGARELIARSEPDLGVLHQEIQKLALFATPDRAVDAATVSQVVASNRLHSIFALTDAIAGGESREALRLIGQLYAEGAAAPYIQFMLAQHFLRLLQVRLLRDAGKRLESVQTEMGRSYAVEKAFAQAARWSPQRILGILRQLYDLEWKAKSGQTEGEGALEALVFRVSGAEVQAESGDRLRVTDTG